jgi:hypothetical protein
VAQKHSDPEIEVWEHLANEWLPVRDYCARRIAELLGRLAAKDATEDMVQVREHQAQIATWKAVMRLPEEQLSQTAREINKKKETTSNGR